MHPGKHCSVIAILLCCLLLVGCAGQTAQPAVTATPAPAAEDGSVTVTTVDELLNAIRPGAKITLAAGTFDLTAASSYGSGSSDWYSWESVTDGYQLVLHGIDGLSIRGAGIAQTSVTADPRYAAVLAFKGCSDVALTNITFGHSDGLGYCTGDVLYLENCDTIQVTGCDLYGCGALAINASSCSGISVSLSILRDCSNGAMDAAYCTDTVLSDCDIYGVGTGDELNSAYSLFYLDSSQGFALVNSTVTDNNVTIAFDISEVQDMYLGGCAIENNQISDSVFSVSGYAPVIESCSFTGNTQEHWYSSDTLTPAVDTDGNAIIRGSAFVNMVCKAVTFTGFDTDSGKGGQHTQDEISDTVTEVHVSSAAEFVAALASNTHIIIDVPELNITEAYPCDAGNYYQWESVYDGVGLVITNAVNLTVSGCAGGTTILATPRYADVLTFLNCRAVTLEDLTVGHTQGSECGGGVIMLRSCTDMALSGCDLFGCGVVGITSEVCSGLQVTGTCIHDCSGGGLWLYSTDNAVFTDCTIRDCTDRAVYLDESCTDCEWNGTRIPSGNSGVLEDGMLTNYSEGEEPLIFQNGELTYMRSMYVGERLLFVSVDDETYAQFKNAEWSFSEPDCVRLTVNEDGSCFLEALQPCEGYLTVMIPDGTGGAAASAECTVSIADYADSAPVG